MSSKHKLWGAVYCYDAYSGEHPGTVRSKYNVIATTKEEAEQKADNLFSKERYGKKLLQKGFYDGGQFRVDNLRKVITECITKIRIPKINGPDSETFLVVPRIRDNCKTIEYLVKER